MDARTPVAIGLAVDSACDGSGARAKVDVDLLVFAREKPLEVSGDVEDPPGPVCVLETKLERRNLRFSVSTFRPG